MIHMDTPEIQAAADRWMQAIAVYDLAVRTGKPEAEQQAAYDAMKAARTQYRSLRKKYEE